MRQFFCIIATLFMLQVHAAGMSGEYIQKDNLFPRVRLETTAGNIVIELDRMKAALTVNNFLTYVDKKVYDIAVPNGSFGATLTQLLPNTTYFFRGYAKNNIGIGYGNVVSFKTKP